MADRTPRQDPEDAHTDLMATLAASRELGPEMDRALAESYMKKHPVTETQPKRSQAVQPQNTGGSVEVSHAGRYILPALAIMAYVAIVLFVPSHPWWLFWLFMGFGGWWWGWGHHDERHAQREEWRNARRQMRYQMRYGYYPPQAPEQQMPASQPQQPPQVSAPPQPAPTYTPPAPGASYTNPPQQPSNPAG
jgi:hypothetical protein